MQSCRQLWASFHAFRSGNVDLAGFRHRQHLEIALCYAASMPLALAHAAFRADLLNALRPLGLMGKYSDTITYFWLSVAAHCLAQRSDDECLARVADEFTARFGDKRLIERHYSPALLAADEARARWIEPDVLPIG